MPEVILVNLGKFQEYILENIRNLLDFGHSVTVLLSKELRSHFTPYDITIIDVEDLQESFYNPENVNDKDFRDGFWQYTSQRLFYVHAYMHQYNRTNCFHIENDVMVYHTLEGLVGNVEKLWLTMDHASRCIPGIVYIPSAEFLRPLLESYDFSQTDIVNMVRFFQERPDLCEAFPILPPQPTIDAMFTKNFRGHIFDAAAIGQYLGGIDGRNMAGDTRGHVNAACVVDYSKYTFQWKLQENRYIPHICVDDCWIPIANLHIHSKQLHRFVSRYPIETLLISKQDSKKEFDIVIPVGPSDYDFVQYVIEYAEKNVKGFRNLYILTNADKEVPPLEGCIVVNERTAPFPFTYKDVEDRIQSKHRTGWYYQQLLKLYACQGIPELLPTYLTLDADTVFLNPVHMIENGKPCYALGDEHHKPYFQHMSVMHPLFRKFHEKSGIAHHMVFEDQYVSEIKGLVEAYHGKPFWEVFLDSVRFAGCDTNGASEYELYFNYMYQYHPDAIQIRDIQWKNANEIVSQDHVVYHYVSVHSHCRKPRNIKVVYPFDSTTLLPHTLLYNSLVDHEFFTVHPIHVPVLSNDAYLAIMRQYIQQTVDNDLLLFVWPTTFVNYGNMEKLNKLLCITNGFITCLKMKDGSENMRVMLVRNNAAVRVIFEQVQSLEQIGADYFTTPLISGDAYDPTQEWCVVEYSSFIKQEDILLEAGKFMDVSDIA